MSPKASVPQKWYNLITESLKSDNPTDRVFALDFLSQQTSLSLEISKELMPSITQSVVYPDKNVRTFARKARNHILDLFPEIDISSSSQEPFKLELKPGEKLTAQQILLHKLRLGSRYLVFEAMDRLTESGDISLIDPLVDYLNQEKDEHKVAYLLRLMGRFDDKRIPEILEKYLDHEDNRIVANTLEALCEFNLPEMSQTFADFAMSSDARIRCNAIRALHRYSPSIAEKHIFELVRSDNFSSQNLGIHLLSLVRPANLGQLLSIANNSRYADIRLKALDIVPPSEAEAANAEMLLKEDIEQPNERRDLAFFIGFLVLSACLFVIVGSNNKYLLALLFAGLAILTVIRPDKTRTSIQKTAISMGIISSVIWGSTRLMLLPALMGLWLTWNGSRFNQRGKLEKAKPESIFAWFFAMTSIIITQFLESSYESTLKLCSNLLEESEVLNLSNEIIAKVSAVVSKQTNFDISIYIFVAIMTIAIMTTDKWLSKLKIVALNKLSARNRLMVVSILCVLLVCVLNLCHVFGLKVLLLSNSFGSVTDVLKVLLP